MLTIDSKLLFKITRSYWKIYPFTNLDAVGLVKRYDRVVSARRKGGRILNGPGRYTGSWRDGVDGQENWKPKKNTAWICKSYVAQATYLSEHDGVCCFKSFKKNLNASKPSEHPPDRGKICQNV